MAASRFPYGLTFLTIVTSPLDDDDTTYAEVLSRPKGSCATPSDTELASPTAASHKPGSSLLCTTSFTLGFCLQIELQSSKPLRVMKLGSSSAPWYTG